MLEHIPCKWDWVSIIRAYMWRVIAGSVIIFITMDYMSIAVNLAEKALGQVSPNPAVGAVIVKNGQIVGEGFTQPPGSSHAEIMALKEAGDNARGATLYVTLEPCCHYGRTPPCTEALIQAGITEVVIAMLDPNPQVSGTGKLQLEAAGLKTSLQYNEKACEINEDYCKYIVTGIPFITAKYAMSLDGKIATREYDSKWITCEDSRRFVHYLRYINDAVMVGSNTVIKDDPLLNVRLHDSGGTQIKQPLRVILDSKAITPLSAAILKNPEKTIIVVSETADKSKTTAYRSAGAKVIEAPFDKNGIDIPFVLNKLGDMSISSVLVEGGGTLLGSMFDQRLVDKVYAFVAPLIIGGSGAVTPVAGKGIGSMVDSIRLERVQIRRFGGDTMVSGYTGKIYCLPA